MPIIKIEYDGEKQYCSVPNNSDFSDVAQAGNLLFILNLYEIEFETKT